MISSYLCRNQGFDFVVGSALLAPLTSLLRSTAALDMWKVAVTVDLTMLLAVTCSAGAYATRVAAPCSLPPVLSGRGLMSSLVAPPTASPPPPPRVTQLPHRHWRLGWKPARRLRGGIYGPGWLLARAGGGGAAAPQI